jgi:hypothetical protein
MHHALSPVEFLEIKYGYDIIVLWMWQNYIIFNSERVKLKNNVIFFHTLQCVALWGDESSSLEF